MKPIYNKLRHIFTHVTEKAVNTKKAAWHTGQKNQLGVQEKYLLVRERRDLWGDAMSRSLYLCLT